MDGDTRKTAILVAGMHRSGTSAVSRILNLLGCALPKTLSSAGPDNPIGFWESMAIKELNERVLASAGSAWDDWEPFDARWYESPVAAEFRDRARTTLADEFGDCRLFVLKDPRICRLLPFWIDSLGEFGAEPFIVTPVRNPLDVAMSVEVRNGIDRSIGLLLWLRHHLDAEVTTRHLRRVYVRYERLISEPHVIADEMSDGLGIVWPRRSTDSNIEIDDFLSPGLRHHRTGDDAFLGNPRLSSWIRDSFEIFDRWASGGHSDADQTTLDGIRSSFNAATPAFGRALAVGVKKSHEVDTLRERLTNEERRAERLATELNFAREEVATATSAAEQLEHRAEELTTELNSAREEIATTTSAAEQLEHRAEGLTTELNSAREEIATTTSAAEQLERRAEQLTTELNSAREEVATTTSAAEQFERRAEQLTTELNSAREEIATTTSAAEQLERRAEQLTTELNSAREEIATATSAAEQLERRAEQLTTELNSAREEIATTTSAAEQLERRAEQLTTELNSAREEIATTTSAAEQLERRAEQLTTELNSAREEIATTTSAAEQLERRAEQLTTELNSAREEIATASSALGEHKNHIVVQSMELKERDKKINELSEGLNETHARAGALDRELQEIRSSTTWRFTGPVRHAGTRAKQLVRIMRSLFRILRSPRSARDILRRAPTIVRNEGYAGLNRRLHRVVDPGAPFPEFAGPHDGANVEFRVPDATSEPDIFVLSIIDWDFRFQRSQHLAIELANSGRRVFYFEMMRHAGDRSIAKIRDNLYRIRLSSRSIGYLQPYFGQADDEQKTAWFEEFCAICDVVQATAFKQVIIQHPYWWQFARSLPPEFQLIHDCMDDISGFSNTDGFVLEMEGDMVRNCDTLVVSSDALHEKYKDIQAPRLIRNAVNIEHLSNDKATNHGIFKQNYPSLQLQLKSTPAADCEVIRIGYVGAIAEWFDADLVRQVAMKEPYYEFHLCGDVSSKDVTAALSDLDNVTMYGEIGYRDVPSFLRRMDVLIIPFKITPIIEACDPVKFYEYSAVGKPTVATPLPELNRVSDLVYLASSAEEFRQKIRNAFDRRGDRDFTSALQEYARRNTWHQRGRDFLEALEDFPLISVIILSYGDAEFTKVAIRSLFERGATYPNLEILVVDNGSPPTEVEKIGECAGKYRGVRVVENGVNLGFAKGNNVGLAQVQGEFVLMLNNDTYVAPGAVYAMARHLARNPKIGAVGSLTNNIGNEARMAVQYENMEQMRRTARQLTWGYRSRNFSVKALGYFAVMFRRRDLECFGLLPEEYGLGMFEDDDHSRTIQSKGYITAVAEDAFVHHHLSASFGTWDPDAKQALFERNRSIFERKWGAWAPHEYRTSRPERVL